MSEWPPNGSEVTFRNGDEELTGVCNGDAFRHESVKDKGPHVYVPVYVRATDKTMVVPLQNIVRWSKP